MLINGMMLLFLYPAGVIVFLVMWGEGKRRGDMLFGIRISEDWISREEIQALEAGYRRRMKRMILVMALMPALFFLVPYTSISLTLWTLWLLAACFLCALPQVMGNRELGEKKRQRGFSQEELRYTETLAAGGPGQVRLLDLAGPVLVSGLLAAAGWIRAGRDMAVLGGLVTAAALCTVLICLCALWTDRMKASVISRDSQVNLNYTRACRRLWKKFWVGAAWLNTLFTGACLWAAWREIGRAGSLTGLLLAASLAYSLLLLWACWMLWRRLREVNGHYEALRDLPDSQEESCWIWGIFYYNPRDAHVMVPKRTGLGTTCNLATPLGKVSVLLTFGILLTVVPIMCGWLILEEFVPISLQVRQGQLVARHLKDTYVLEVSQVEDVTLTEELPHCSKVSGTGMDNLLKGTFHNSEEGKFEMFCNPRNHLFLRLQVQGTVYYMSGFDDEQTRQVYEALSLGSAEGGRGEPVPAKEGHRAVVGPQVAGLFRSRHCRAGQADFAALNPGPGGTVDTLRAGQLKAGYLIQ